MHDLASTIGNSAALSLLSALAAGLAALALMSGVSKLAKSSLPNQYPEDPEAQLDKYVQPFRQLDQVGRASAQDISSLATQMRNQPAAHMALTSFQKFRTIQKDFVPGQGSTIAPGGERTKTNSRTMEFSSDGRTRSGTSTSMQSLQMPEDTDEDS